MVLKCLIFGFVLLLNFVDSQNDATNKKNNLAAIKAFTDFGTATTKAGVQQTKETIIDAVTKLGVAIPKLGPLTSFLSGILSIAIKQPDQLADVKNKLANIDGHLFRIENKIDEIYKKIDKKVEQIDFRRHLEKLEFLQDSYQRYIENPNSYIAKQTLINNCNRNGPLEFINNADRQLASGQPLYNLMLNEMDLKNFMTWSRLLTNSYGQVLFLHSVCLALQHPDSRDRTTIIENDINMFNRKWYKLSVFIPSGIDYIIKNFWEKAKDEIKDIAKGEIHGECDQKCHEEFYRKVDHHLTNKYYWRKWMINSYDKSVRGFDWHTVAGDGMPWVLYWFDKFGRSVYITSTNSNVNFEVKLQNCIDSEIKGKSYKNDLKEIFDKIRRCLGSYNGLGIIKTDRRPLVHYHYGEQNPGIVIVLENIISRCNVFTVRSHYCPDPEKARLLIFASAPEI